MAKGSHATLGGWEPKTCGICQQPIRVSNPDRGLWFHYDDTNQQGYAWHSECLRNKRKEATT